MMKNQDKETKFDKENFWRNKKLNHQKKKIEEVKQKAQKKFSPTEWIKGNREFLV